MTKTKLVWNKGHKMYSKEQLIKICKDYNNHYKTVPTLAELSSYSSIKPDHFIDAFGNWSCLLKETGLDPIKNRYLKQWSRTHISCITCGTQKIRHYGKGLCTTCYISQSAKKIKNDKFLLTKQRIQHKGYAAKKRLNIK